MSDLDEKDSLAPPDRLIRLDGRVILVTGAGGGIGTGVVQRLIAAGATVVAHTRSSPVDHLIDLNGVPVSSVRADLSAPDGPKRVIDAAITQHGRLDGLVNNAGIQPLADLADVSEADWSEMLDVNLTAAHRLTQRAATAMRRTSAAGDETGGSREAGTRAASCGTASARPGHTPAGGSVVHIASIEGHQPADLHGHYAVAKAGLLMHARAAASAYGRYGIRVNSISPGLINRPGLTDDWPQGVSRWQAAAPLGRLGTAADIGDACVFLCSDLARWITGIDLAVDGGVLTRPTW